MKNSPETLVKRNKLKREWKKNIDPSSFPHYIKRKCKDCGEVADCQWQHAFTQTGLPEYRVRCVKCYNKYRRQIQKKARSRITNQKRERSRRNKQKCVEYLGGKCVKCGYNKSIYALTFHHRDPLVKEKDVCSMIKDLSFSNPKLLSELNKCDLLCFNCHMEFHGEKYVQI